ncbi:MAG: ABC transporter substrate-binding protein [Chloroflexi bacterium]|nr:ABC transporter substrate-binding protein [Chloroflexota bacterium]MYF82386.1 ABC transporter substrate-binding protein [Chloroflexota bacterium]MYI05666.1 ABC transporter substrate-binding protein [Chloroflexota bacterium]
MSERNYWKRMQRKRLSRRSLISASARAGVGAAGLALVGCGDDDDDQQAAAQVQQAAQADQEQVQAQQQAQQVATQQAQTQEEAMEEQAVALLPGQLTAEEEAMSLTAEQEWRLRYHWSKLQNLPGQADGPKHGGTWRLAHAAPANWNVLGPNASLMAAFAPMFYSQLVVFPMDDYANAHYYVNEGDLAAGWEVPEPTTVVFQLQDGITWQNKPPVNGRAMTAEDVKIAYDALREEGRVQASSYTAVNSIDYDNASNNVRFNLAEPAAYLLNNMMNPFHTVVAPEFVEEPSLLDLAENTVGTGPFQLDSATTGSEWRGSKHPEYHKLDPRTGLQLPYIDNIHGLDFVGQRESEWAAWETGETDWIRLQDITEYDRAIEQHPEMVVQVTAPPPGWQPHMTFKDLTAEPFNDPRVRQALSLGMDRDEQAAGVYYGLAAGGYGQNWTFFKDESSPWGFREWPWTFEELGDFHVFNAAEGKKLLDAAGYNEDNPLSFQAAFHTVPGFYLDHFLLVVDQWNRNLGANVTHEQIEWESWLALLFTKEYSGTLFTWLVGSEMDADGLAYGRMHSESPGNIYGINDPDVDQWAVEQRQELDVEKRSEILEKIRVRELENMWRIFCVNPYRMAARREYLFGQMDTYNAWNPGWGATNTERIWKNL